jgi:hypothetical protein
MTQIIFLLDKSVLFWSLFKKQSLKIKLLQDLFEQKINLENNDEIEIFSRNAKAYKQESKIVWYEKTKAPNAKKEHD